MWQEVHYQLALTQVPQLGSKLGRALIEYWGSARAIFEASMEQLSEIPGMGVVRAKSIKSFSNFKSIDKAWEAIQKRNIQAIWIQDANYPKLLKHCEDAPLILYVKGNANCLRQPHILSVVGTRQPTSYGLQLCKKWVSEWSQQQITIVSGLAYGIDITAHQATLDADASTIAVLAHGLDQIYPPLHADIAKSIMDKGALISDFPLFVTPRKHHFVRRNRIIAGLSEATVVIESGLKGGSLITADLANGYHREVFAIPGRVTDEQAAGCLRLIQQQQAIPLCKARDVPEALNWKLPSVGIQEERAELPLGLSELEVHLLKLLTNAAEPLFIEQILQYVQAGFSTLAHTLLQLELVGLVESIGGNSYRIGMKAKGFSF